MGKGIFEQFENGMVTIGNNTKDISAIPWNEHKDFVGVFLKNIVTGDMTNGQFTCLLVRIEPNHKIGLHKHLQSVELHEVVAGSGVCATECGDIVYSPGSMAVLECNSDHEVRAGDAGLCLFAKFFNLPA